MNVQTIDIVGVPFRTRVLHLRRTRSAMQARCSCGWKSREIPINEPFGMHEAMMERDYHRFDCGKSAVR